MEQMPAIIKAALQKQNSVEGKQWIMFEDRMQALLARWGEFKARYNSVEGVDKLCIMGFLREADDEFTKALLKL